MTAQTLRKVSLEFVDELPEKKTRGHRFLTSWYWDAVAEEIRRNPGRWAVLEGEATDRRTHVAEVLNRRLIRHGVAEVSARRGVLYARFVGPDA